ncbi:MAG: hypothetical protein IK990_14180 [Ruminiclostridium sp.]|nr:hypothetical protein [Ruminiclostridium sp.]
MWYDSTHKTWKDIREGRTDWYTAFIKETLKPALIIISVLLIFSLGVFLLLRIVEDNSLIHGEKGMLEYARQAHGDGLEFTGSVSHGGETIAWFTADPSNPICIPIVFSQKGKDTYSLANDPNSFREADACHFLWHSGFAIHIENPDIAEIQIVSGGNTVIPVTQYPFNTYWDFDGGNSTSIYYLDKDGNIVKND